MVILRTHHRQRIQQRLEELGVTQRIGAMLAAEEITDFEVRDITRYREAGRDELNIEVDFIEPKSGIQRVIFIGADQGETLGSEEEPLEDELYLQLDGMARWKEEAVGVVLSELGIQRQLNQYYSQRGYNPQFAYFQIDALYYVDKERWELPESQIGIAVTINDYTHNTAEPDALVVSRLKGIVPDTPLTEEQFQTMMDLAEPLNPQGFSPDQDGKD